MDLHVGNPVVRGALTLFPIFNGEAVSVRGYDLGGGALRVGERAGAPVVGELVVTNRGTRPALLTEGELLTGGQQNRVVARPVIVGPGRSAVVEVRCVEQGRWDGDDGQVRSRERASALVRSAQDQGEVWRRIAGYGTGGTVAFQDVAAERRTAGRALTRGLRPLAFQAGVLVGVAGRPLLMEVFDSPRSLATVWQELLAGVAVDAVGAPPDVTPGYRARRFVGRLSQVGLSPVAGGDGTGFAGAGHYARVGSLHWRGRAVVTVATNTRHPMVVVG